MRAQLALLSFTAVYALCFWGRAIIKSGNSTVQLSNRSKAMFSSFEPMQQPCLLLTYTLSNITNLKL